MLKDKKKLVISAALLLLVAVTGYQFLQHRAQNSGATILVSGNSEVTEAEVSFKIPGRVVERLVSEGETIESGQTVARLDSSELAREVGIRQAEVQAAQAALAGHGEELKRTA